MAFRTLRAKWNMTGIKISIKPPDKGYKVLLTFLCCCAKRFQRIMLRRIKASRREHSGQSAVKLAFKEVLILTMY